MKPPPPTYLHHEFKSPASDNNCWHCWFFYNNEPALKLMHKLLCMSVTMWWHSSWLPAKTHVVVISVSASLRWHSSCLTGLHTSFRTYLGSLFYDLCFSIWTLWCETKWINQHPQCGRVQSHWWRWRKCSTSTAKCFWFGRNRLKGSPFFFTKVRFI